MSQSLKHVTRTSPTWSTGPEFTICGNRAVDGDLDWETMRAYIDKECRGSIHVAGATCCVTCLQNAKNELRSWGGTSPQGQMIARYLTKINARRHPENAIRRQAEIEALDELVKVHRREYEAAVDRIIGQRQWREMKTKSGPL